MDHWNDSLNIHEYTHRRGAFDFGVLRTRISRRSRGCAAVRGSICECRGRCLGLARRESRGGLRSDRRWRPRETPTSRCGACFRAVPVLYRACGAIAFVAAGAGGRDGHRPAAAVDAGREDRQDQRGFVDGGVHHSQHGGIRPRFRAAQRASGLGSAARCQNRVDWTDTQRLETSVRRRTGCGFARPDSGGGVTEPAIRRRSQSRDAICGAARRRHCGCPISRGGSPSTGLAGRVAQDGSHLREPRFAGSAALAWLRAAQAAGPAAGAVTRGFWFALPMLAIAACATRLPPAPPVAGAEPFSVAALSAAIDADAKRSDHEPDAKIRGELAADAGRDAEACLSREPRAAACLYGQAIALGLEARVLPARAGELLKTMLEPLTRAESADPNYEEAGPARVRALVLIRAPGWPLGPGDPEAGLAAARRAVSLRPLYPPNLLALAGALAKTGDGNGARDYYTRAHDAALALPAAADRDEWLRESEQGLQRK